MIKLVDKHWCPLQSDYQHEYICDAEADVAELPACCTGSAALVVDSGAVYMVNASGAWAVFGG